MHPLPAGPRAAALTRGQRTRPLPFCSPSIHPVPARGDGDGFSRGIQPSPESATPTPHTLPFSAPGQRSDQVSSAYQTLSNPFLAFCSLQGKVAKMVCRVLFDVFFACLRLCFWCLVLGPCRFSAIPAELGLCAVPCH